MKTSTTPIYTLILTVFMTSISAMAADGGLERSATEASDDSKNQPLASAERATRIIEREVRSQTDQRLGRVEDILVDLESGRIIYAVVLPTGRSGEDERQVAVPVSALQQRGSHLRMDADREKLNSAPRVKAENPKEQTAPAFASSVNKHFGQARGWWENAAGESGEKFGNARMVNDLIGMDVRNVSNTKIAEVQNVILDLDSARVPFVILEPDDSLELKNKLYAIPPNSLTASSGGDALNTGIDRDQLSSAPSFGKDGSPDFSDRSWASRVYQHYGKQPYFQSGTLQPTSNPTNAQERIYHEPDRDSR